MRPIPDRVVSTGRRACPVSDWRSSIPFVDRGADDWSDLIGLRAMFEGGVLRAMFEGGVLRAMCREQC